MSVPCLNPCSSLRRPAGSAPWRERARLENGAGRRGLGHWGSHLLATQASHRQFPDGGDQLDAFQGYLYLLTSLPSCKGFYVASGGPLGTRMRVRVVVYAWRLAVNRAVRYSPRWIGPEIVPFASVPAKMKVIELPGR